ncbi:hypothetical protein AC629_04250 [Bradyrhizobium sp. NAS80.1]|nr:hypothetical protein AC629_04250 [Bradyrhizobium sp. NAS80.1]
MSFATLSSKISDWPSLRPRTDPGRARAISPKDPKCDDWCRSIAGILLCTGSVDGALKWQTASMSGDHKSSGRAADRAIS